MIGLGLALARPKNRIAVITGDGEMLMGLGGLATIGVKQPRNLAIVVLDNRHYGETGMQASHTNSGVDLVGVARACRFSQARAISADHEVEAARRLLHGAEGPLFIQAQVEAANLPRVLPTRDGNENRLRFMQGLAELS